MSEILTRREQAIADLRAFVEWLAVHEGVPVPVRLSDAIGIDRQDLIREIAACAGTQVKEAPKRGVTGTTIRCGTVTYHLFSHTRAAMDEYYARESYSGNVRVDGGEQS